MDICLSVSGGGILGVGPAKFLSLLEKDLGRSTVYSTFNGFAGTSTGAIIVSLLNEKIKAADVLKLYEKDGSKIFKKYTIWDKLKEKGVQPKYDNSHLKKLLQEKLSGVCSQWKKEIFIPVCDMKRTNNPEKIFDRSDSETAKWFAVLASTSAPIYFIPAGADKNWIDGGLFANNPVGCLQAGYRKRTGKERFKILHLNTTMTLNTKGEEGNKTMLGWAAYLLQHFVARSSQSEIYKARANLGDENVFVVSPEVSKKFEMDGVAQMDDVKKIWENEYAKVKDDLLAWLREE
ncbi:MAG: patatin-like phospholipase family protein [Fibrobacteraceae bacterium]|nr:patatin-like phospholipase family protein [Fibrobacteraceae bacterium]